ncbi:MAG: TonB-dependent receptor [Gammaproteobacteria bacterium]|nr:TonB-dependent receptor [Gammaproteobacteria bacterium]MDH3428373.1 TonB-dependent receptor [Gammaproteobacteria bacterium]
MDTLRRGLAVLLGITVGFSAIGTHAQELAFDEIIVTAQKREQSLQEVPISVSVLSGDKIEEAGIDNLDDLALYVPNFSKGESGGGAIVQMRGIATGANPAYEQSVTMYMDDISLARAPLARMPLMDLERVEVLRGPQNVLFGKNAIAGALSLVTAKPTDAFEGSLALRYGDYDDGEAIAVLSGPLSDTLRGRLAVRYAEYGGYYENASSGKDEERREETAIRGTLAWEVGEDAEAIFKYEHNTIDSDGQAQELVFGYDSLIPGFEGLDYTETVAQFQAYYNLGFIPANPAFPPPIDVGSDDISMDRVRRSTYDAYQDLDLNKVQLTFNQNFDNFTFTSVTGYIDYAEDRLAAGAFGGIDISTVLLTEEYEQLSQEIRFTSDTDGTFQWIAGAFFQTWELDAAGTTFIDEDNVVVLAGLTLGPTVAGLESVANIAGTLDYTGESTSYAAFGQFTWNVSDSARLTLGGRYTRETKRARRVNDSINQLTGAPDFTQMIFASCFQGIDYNSLGELNQLVPLPGCDPTQPPAFGNYNTHDIVGDRTENFFTPSITLEFDVGDSNLLYVTGSTGFKAGGFDSRGAAIADWEFEDEEVTGYEIGLKSSFAGGRGQTSIAYFDSDYDDLQVTTFDGVARFAVGNAAEYSAKGIEADGRWRATENFTLAGSLAWIDAGFVDYEGATCNARFALLNPVEAADGCSRTGVSPSNTPEWSGNLVADWILPVSDSMDFRATLDVNYEDDYDTEPTKEVGLVQDAYTKYNLRLALEADNWTFAVLGKNLSDEDVLEFSGIEALSGSFWAAPVYYGYLQPPRTISAQFDYRF